MNGRNREITTMQLQISKKQKLNCMQHFITTLQNERQKVH